MADLDKQADVVDLLLNLYQSRIDVANILVRCEKSLNRPLILQELSELVQLADDFTAMPRLQELLDRQAE